MTVSHLPDNRDHGTRGRSGIRICLEMLVSHGQVRRWVVVGGVSFFRQGGEHDPGVPLVGCLFLLAFWYLSVVGSGCVLNVTVVVT